MTTKDTEIQPRQFTRNLLALQYRELMMVLATGTVLVATVALFPGVDSMTDGVNAEVGTLTLLFFFAVAIFSGAVKGALGFGYALITTPVFATVIDPTLAVVVLAIPPWMINLFQIGETRTGLTYIKREWTLILLAIVGSFAGVFFLSTFQTGPAIPFLIGVLLFGYVLFEVGKDFVVIEKAHNPVALGTVGLVEGFLLAAANLGPLLPAYLHTFERDTERYVGGLSMIFTFVFTERIVQMWFNGLLTPYRLWLGSAIATVTIVGLLLGTYLRRLEVDEAKFNWIVIIMLFIISLNIFRKTVPALFL
ncbi:sulfite exporter TauE/SafE family protein [Halomicrococcus gelatinilyticus]|uniref:sulfite exporter TauE/SafE family protein n=1 Tax=Halomicrococcus gelatinilyticus TaxID=1702103 RepID=UPI002E0FCC4E